MVAIDLSDITKEGFAIKKDKSNLLTQYKQSMINLIKMNKFKLVVNRIFKPYQN